MTEFDQDTFDEAVEYVRDHAHMAVIDTGQRELLFTYNAPVGKDVVNRVVDDIFISDLNNARLDLQSRIAHKHIHIRVEK